MLQGRESSPKSYQQIVSSGQHDKLAIGADLREEEVHWILNWGKVNLIFDKMNMFTLDFFIEEKWNLFLIKQIYVLAGFSDSESQHNFCYLDIISLKTRLYTYTPLTLDLIIATLLLLVEKYSIQCTVWSV